jgi:subtilase family serine protease
MTRIRKWIQQVFDRRSPSMDSSPPKLRFVPKVEVLEGRDLPSVGLATPDFIVNFDPSTATYTPTQIRAAYGVNKITFSSGTVTGNGKGQTIAIVDAYDDPNIAKDLKSFDTKYKLPTGTVTVYNQTGSTSSLPGTDSSGGWEEEESLDVEWAHALAPGASIDLVEANSATNSDLFTAVKTAAGLSGVSVVSMSWGIQGGFKGETKDDSMFNVSGVTFFASTGDSGSPGNYPAESPYVVAVGGTTLNLSSGAWSSETGWSGSGGGKSKYETRPAFQNNVSSVTGSARGTPDVSFDANPNTGVWIYDSYDEAATGGPNIAVGGTSLSSPAWAGIMAIADQGRTLGKLSTLSSLETLTALYGLSSSDFHDIVKGSNGGFKAGTGYDLVTGIGSPIANNLVPDLVNYSTTNLVVAGSGGSSGGQSHNRVGSQGHKVHGAVLAGATAAFNDFQIASEYAYAAFVAGNGSYAAYVYANDAAQNAQQAITAAAAGDLAKAESDAAVAYNYGKLAAKTAYADWSKTGSSDSYQASSFDILADMYANSASRGQ